MPSLTTTQLSAIVEGDLSKVPLIDLSDRQLDEIEDLSLCKSLKRIELKNNSLESLEFLHMNFELKWIDAQHNRLSGHFGSGLRNLSQLSVLNLSHNQITNVDNLFDGLHQLKSLVLSNNHLTSIKGIAKLQNLEALILSSNRLESFDMPKRQMPALKKLSLGNNRIKTFTLDTNVFNLKELRLHGNQLTDVPSNLYCCGLEILDLGKNSLSVPTEMGAAQYCMDRFRRCKKLKALNLAGNVGLAKTGEEWDRICRKIKGEVASLQIFNSKKFEDTMNKRERKRVQRPEGIETNDGREMKKQKKSETCRVKPKRREEANEASSAPANQERAEQDTSTAEVKNWSDKKSKKKGDSKRKEVVTQQGSSGLAAQLPSVTEKENITEAKMNTPIMNLNNQVSFINKINQLTNRMELLGSWED